MLTMLGRPVVAPPPEGSLPFLDGESAHVRVWNLDRASSSLLSSHQPRLNCPRPPSRRGASPSHSTRLPKPSSMGTSRFTLPLLLPPPPDSAPCPCNLPCDPSARWIPHSFPCRALFCQSLPASQDEPAPKTSRGSTTPPLHPRQPCRGRSLALPLWRPQWRGGQHHSRSIQPNLIEMFGTREEAEPPNPRVEKDKAGPPQTMLSTGPKCIVDCAVSTTALGRPHRLNCNLPWSLGPAEHVECSVVVFDPCPFRTHNQDIAMYPCKPEPT